MSGVLVRDSELGVASVLCEAFPMLTRADAYAIADRLVYNSGRSEKFFYYDCSFRFGGGDGAVFAAASCARQSLCCLEYHGCVM